jgi:hypothetical protein
MKPKSKATARRDPGKARTCAMRAGILGEQDCIMAASDPSDPAALPGAR